MVVISECIETFLAIKGKNNIRREVTKAREITKYGIKIYKNLLLHFIVGFFSVFMRVNPQQNIFFIFFVEN